jgi:methyl-accepting chemotaxis protein
MSTIKRIFGFLGVVLGAVGLLFCLVVIICAWWINGPITDGLLQVFPPIEAVLSFGDTTVAEFSGFAADTQTQFTQFTDARPVASALEDEIQQITVYINATSTVVDSVEQIASGLMESVRPGRTGTVISNSASRLLETLNDITATLDLAESLAQQIGDGRSDKIDMLTEQLDILQSNLAAIETAINQTENDVADIKSKLPRWINTGSLIVTLIFSWFGIAQSFLLQNSWQYLRHGHGGRVPYWRMHERHACLSEK